MGKKLKIIYKRAEFMRNQREDLKSLEIPCVKTNLKINKKFPKSKKVV
jgi:hypothetical protein